MILKIRSNWYKVPGFLIEVTKYGDVRNSVTKKVKSQHLQRGYLNTNVERENGKRTAVGIHILVALVFCKGYRKGLEVNHKDTIKSNNYYKNLEWVTGKKNMQHASINGLLVGNISEKDRVGNRITNRKGSKNPYSKLTERDILSIKYLCTSKQFSQAEIAKEFGVTQPLISKINTNKIWKELSL